MVTKTLAGIGLAFITASGISHACRWEEKHEPARNGVERDHTTRPTHGCNGAAGEIQRKTMRDPRFPSHTAVMHAILVWGSEFEYYTNEEVRDGVAQALGVTEELQAEVERSSSTTWTNCVAHGLSWFTRLKLHTFEDCSNSLSGDGDRCYRLTERGKVLASKAREHDPDHPVLRLLSKWSAENDELFAGWQARLAMLAAEPITVEAMLDDINETAMELATNAKADPDVLVNHIEELTATLRTMWPEANKQES
jgi:hypothetical protein